MQTTTNYSGLRQSGKLYGTIKRAKELRAQREENKPVSNDTWRPRLTKIPLGDETAKNIRVAAMEQRPRVQRWVMPAASSDVQIKYVRIREIDQGHYSSSCTYHMIDYQPTIRCCGKVTAKHLVAFVGEKHIKITAYRGWVFGRDNLGLYIVRKSQQHKAHMRYHFDSDDLESRKLLHDNAKHHDAEDRQRAIDLGVYVCFQDSIDSENSARRNKTYW